MIAVVTGGSKGIGLAVARAFIARGDSVTIGARSDAELASAAHSLGAPDRVHAVRTDVRQPADCERLVTETVSRFGGLDVLVNNAGVGRFSAVADMRLDDWQAVIETNLSGVFYCTRAALPEMRRRGGGYIVNISSLAGKNAFSGGAAYCASKAGLDQFSEALMQEVRQDNIRVSYVMPGSVATQFGGGPGDEPWKLAPEDVARVVIDLVDHDPRSLPSRVELRPSRPPRKS
ncbi:MAG TPA: SDR family oxidoreductase [Vicinamibacterales bacterium]|jgi:NAD(P)-dependent dehydrogenase (short-subunit alcohol dehydrogenase family)